MGALGLGAALNIGSTALQGIFSGIQLANSNKQFNKLFKNRPQYNIPQEYQQILSQYQQAYRSDMPGYAQTLSNVGRAGARARGAAERGAISSNAYGAQIGDIYQKELDALQNLGIQQAQYKSAQLGNVAQAEGAMAGQKEQQWNINQYVPYQTELNRWGEQKKQSTENLYGAMQGGISGLTDLLGTKYYTDVLKGLYPKNNG